MTEFLIVAAAAFLLAPLARVGLYHADIGQVMGGARWIRNAVPWGPYGDPRSGDGHPVRLQLTVADANRVYLVGTFNHWLGAAYLGARIDPDPAYELQRDGDDSSDWVLEIRDFISGARYDYAFCVDRGGGYWHWVPDLDPDAIRSSVTGFSTLVIPHGERS